MANTMHIEITDNSGKVKEEFEAAVLRALEKCGLTAEGYAKKLCPVDTGNLRNSITHQVDPGEPAAYVGSNSEYAAYVELGTGKYYPGGRQGWWVYVKGSDPPKGKKPGKIYTKEEAVRIMMALRRKGLDAHITDGSEPKPYLKPAVADNVGTYRKIIEDELKNG